MWCHIPRECECQQPFAGAYRGGAARALGRLLAQVVQQRLYLTRATRVRFAQPAWRTDPALERRRFNLHRNGRRPGSDAYPSWSRAVLPPTRLPMSPSARRCCGAAARSASRSPASEMMMRGKCRPQRVTVTMPCACCTHEKGWTRTRAALQCARRAALHTNCVGDRHGSRSQQRTRARRVVVRRRVVILTHLWPWRGRSRPHSRKRAAKPSPPSRGQRYVVAGAE